MNFFCTKKVLKHVVVCEEIQVDYNSLFSWYCNIVELQDSYRVIFVHERTYYPLVLEGVCEVELRNLEWLWQQALLTATKLQGLDDYHVAMYLDFSHKQHLYIHKTTSRKVLGVMQQYMRSAQNMRTWEIDLNSKLVINVSLDLAENPVKKDGRYVIPRQAVECDLLTFDPSFKKSGFLC
ncbi:hypothetical protein A4S06_02620 [Erysipelotrichaceae bacterium MTC7]|nr:hypothetical protein A4S06_02620 [Erysipelotrichaceae bacterium MTC7]